MAPGLQLARSFMTRVVFAVWLLGCGARSELDVPSEPDAAVLDAHHHVAPEDAGIDVIDEPIPYIAVCDVPDAGRPAIVCNKTLDMGAMIVPSSCVNDYAVTSGDVGVLEYACESDSNWASVTFEGNTFPGSIHGNFVDVCIGTTFPFQEGAACEWSHSVWSTAQRIFGDYTTGTLTYTYADKMLTGHSCWGPCFAHADITVQ